MGSLVIFQRRLPRDQWGTQRVKRGRVGPRSDAGVARVDRQTVAGHVILTSFSSPSVRTAQNTRHKCKHEPPIALAGHCKGRDRVLGASLSG